ncbi:hypothetical protein AVEN_152167-1 [Araneus ventricosus]|uniref:ATP-dependent DNA helicase n=1 Tax=Araneus ventricosus TaxID=182803 RepID=A0A4Y2HKQ1_ARAVE|nr:hypothetical protein AVEN_152167-1 [Araneus ventricosus]
MNFPVPKKMHKEELHLLTHSSFKPSMKLSELFTTGTTETYISTGLPWRTWKNLPVFYTTIFCSWNKKFLSLGTTGIAATLLKSGRTVHSDFKLPVPALETSVSETAT